MNLTDSVYSKGLLKPDQQSEDRVISNFGVLPPCFNPKIPVYLQKEVLGSWRWYGEGLNARP